MWIYSALGLRHHWHRKHHTGRMDSSKYQHILEANPTLKLSSQQDNDPKHTFRYCKPYSTRLKQKTTLEIDQFVCNESKIHERCLLGSLHLAHHRTPLLTRICDCNRRKVEQRIVGTMEADSGSHRKNERSRADGDVLYMYTPHGRHSLNTAVRLNVRAGTAP